jgi:hypothetical protein
MKDYKPTQPTYNQMTPLQIISTLAVLVVVMLATPFLN